MSLSSRSSFVVLLLILVMLGHSQESNVRTDDSGNNFEAEFWNRIKAKNWAAVAMMLDTEIVAANRGQILRGKDAVIEHVKRIDLSKFSYTDVAIRQDKDIVVVAFRMTALATGGGEPEPMNWRMISVWRKRDKAWLMISHAAIPVEDP